MKLLRLKTFCSQVDMTGKERTVIGWIKSKEIKGKKIGGLWFIQPEEIAKLRGEYYGSRN